MFLRLHSMETGCRCVASRSVCDCRRRICVLLAPPPDFLCEHLIAHLLYSL